VSDDRLYFRQLLSGRDYAVGDPIATQMVNFTYVIGDRHAREAVVVDPCYRVADILDVLENDGMRCVGALATHHHPDHVGGTMMGHRLEGIAELLAGAGPVPIHVHEAELPYVQRVTGVSTGDLVGHDSGDTVTVGAIPIQVLHTPGHTPGSQCFLVDRMLVSGDTLFLEGCGRTDFPGSDPAAMFDSLHRLASLPDDVAVYAGHKYSTPSVASLAMVKETNYVYRPATKDQWLAMFGS
jgi:glyoxylase-like metal-dependent hydrolase (beta-lactamase superfamily II)